MQWELWVLGRRPGGSMWIRGRWVIVEGASVGCCFGLIVGREPVGGIHADGSCCTIAPSTALL